MKRLAIVVIAGTLLGILLGYEPIVRAEKNINNIEEIQEVKIETDKEKIVRLINETFPDAPIMMKVAKCESEFKNIEGLLSDDAGPFQINQVHKETLKKLGLNRFVIEDNIKFARILYNE